MGLREGSDMKREGGGHPGCGGVCDLLLLRDLAHCGLGGLKGEYKLLVAQHVTFRIGQALK